MKLNEITPQEFMCSDCSPCCPAVYETEDNRYVIVGKKTDADAIASIAHKIGDDEYAIVVEKGMIDQL